MVRRKPGDLPSSKTIARRVKELGGEVWKEYVQLREKYKKEHHLTPRQAVERSYKELRIEDRVNDLRLRDQVTELTGRDVAMTSDEVREVYPNFRSPMEVTADHIGDQELSFAEEVLWARDAHAMVKSGKPSPVTFPSKGALGWYQFSLTSHEKFMSHVAAVSKPQSSGDDAYMKDGEYRFKEIESQLVEALRECGEKMVELEKEFADQLTEVLTNVESNA